MRSPGLRSYRHSLKAGMESVKPLAKEVAGKCWGFLSARSLLVPSPAGCSPYSFQWPACPHFLSLYPTPPASQCHSFTSLPSSEMRQAWLVWPPLGRPSSCHLFEAPFDGLPSPVTAHYCTVSHIYWKMWLRFSSWDSKLYASLSVPSVCGLIELMSDWISVTLRGGFMLLCQGCSS